MIDISLIKLVAAYSLIEAEIFEKWFIHRGLQILSRREGKGINKNKLDSILYILKISLDNRFWEGNYEVIYFLSLQIFHQ